MKRILFFSLLVALGLFSCGQAQPVIEFGKAECAHCRMNVVDRQFGAAITTTKGRQYVFDDVACMIHFVDAGTVAEGEVAGWYVCDHATPATLIDATTAFYLHGPAFRSPMRGDIAAFSTTEQRQKAQADASSEPLDWSGVRSTLKK